MPRINQLPEASSVAQTDVLAIDTPDKTYQVPRSVLAPAPYIATIPTGQWSGSGSDYYITVTASNVTADAMLYPFYDNASAALLNGPVWVIPAAGSFTIHTSAIPSGTVTISVLLAGIVGEAQYQVLADVYSKDQVDSIVAQSTANGTWTPTVSGGNATGITVSQGRWYRQGNLVMLTCKWAATAANSGTYATISGNPFTSVNNPMGSTINQSTGKTGLAFGGAGAATFNLYFAPGQAETANGNAGYAYILFPISA